jgi:hypothetical protein
MILSYINRLHSVISFSPFSTFSRCLTIFYFIQLFHSMRSSKSGWGSEGRQEMRLRFIVAVLLFHVGSSLLLCYRSLNQQESKRAGPKKCTHQWYGDTASHVHPFSWRESWRASFFLAGLLPPVQFLGEYNFLVGLFPIGRGAGRMGVRGGMRGWAGHWDCSRLDAVRAAWRGAGVPGGMRGWARVSAGGTRGRSCPGLFRVRVMIYGTSP